MIILVRVCGIGDFFEKQESLSRKLDILNILCIVYTESSLYLKVEGLLMFGLDWTNLGPHTHKAFVFFTTISCLAVGVGVGITLVLSSFLLFPFPVIGGGVVTVFLVIRVVQLTVKGIRLRIGTEQDPCYGIQTFAGRPIAVHAEGPLFLIPWIEGIARRPASEYASTYKKLLVHSMKQGDMGVQVVTGTLNVRWFWPHPEEWYSFPLPIEKAKNLLGRGEIQEIPPKPPEGSNAPVDPNREKLPDLKTPGLEWFRVKGSMLLRDYSYWATRGDLLGGNASNDLVHHLRDSFGGVYRDVMAHMNHLDMRQEPEEIEKEMKRALLDGEDNAVYRMGLPFEMINLRVPELRFPEDTEAAWREKEIAKHQADASKERAKRITAEMEAYALQGVDKNIAALIVGGGVKGGGLTIDQLRDLSIFERFSQQKGGGGAKGQR